MLSSIRSAAANMSGYFSGLSSPSVTESTTTLCASPRSNAAGQTRLPTFSMNSAEPGGGASVSRAWPTICASRWQPLPVLIWIAGRAGGADALGVVGGLLIALDHATAMRSFSASIVLTSRVVLPEPGLETTLSANTPRAAKARRLSRA